MRSQGQNHLMSPVTRHLLTFRVFQPFDRQRASRAQPVSMLAATSSQLAIGSTRGQRNRPGTSAAVVTTGHNCIGHPAAAWRSLHTGAIHFEAIVYRPWARGPGLCRQVRDQIEPGSDSANRNMQPGCPSSSLNTFVVSV
jgi:hypothetical protein